MQNLIFIFIIYLFHVCNFFVNLIKWLITIANYCVIYALMYELRINNSLIDDAKSFYVKQ